MVKIKNDHNIAFTTHVVSNFDKYEVTHHSNYQILQFLIKKYTKVNMPKPKFLNFEGPGALLTIKIIKTKIEMETAFKRYIMKSIEQISKFTEDNAFIGKDFSEYSILRPTVLFENDLS